MGMYDKGISANGEGFPIFKVHTTLHPLVCSKTNLKPRDLTHLGKILLLRLRCRTSTEGNKSKKKQTYRITSTQKKRSSSSCSCGDCSEHVSLFSRQILHWLTSCRSLIHFTLGCSNSCLYFWRCRRADHLIKSQNAETLTVR